MNYLKIKEQNGWMNEWEIKSHQKEGEVKLQKRENFGKTSKNPDSLYLKSILNKNINFSY